MIAITRWLRSGLFLAGLGLSSQACGSASTAASDDGSIGETFHVPAGQELAITLRTVGAGAYDSLPSISTPAVQFLGASFVPPHVPAGPTQRFRFHAATPGVAIVTFHHTGANPVVSDTVIVQ